MSGKAQERKDVKLSSVEQVAVEASGFDVLYQPTEKIPTIIVNNFPALGKLAAMRFIEWVQHNPGGVISLPTGKTPEHFIKWVMRLLDGWDSDEIQEELKVVGINPAVRPDMASLHFVQIDEFYPMDSSQENSFHHYVKEFYLKGFGLDAAKALLIDSSSIGLEAGEKLSDVWPGNMVDLSLRYRQATSQRQRDQKALLEAKANEKTGEVRRELKAKLSGLRESKDQAERRLDELRLASKPAWEDVKQGVEKAWHSLSDAIDRATERLHQ